MVIAGTHSGVGKTTLTLGIMAALKERGLVVQPFKIGPDYIDPSYQTFITGMPSRNLDGFMLGEDKIKYLFNKASQEKDISIIEGVMGLYDGKGSNKDDCSTASMAKLLKSPVLLVIDGRGMAASSAAIVKGYQQLDTAVHLVGVIVNNIKTARHYELIKEAIENYCEIPVLGYFPPNDQFKMSSRHLGLVPYIELEGLKDQFKTLAQEIEKYINIDKIIELSKGEALSTHFSLQPSFNKEESFELKHKRIAVAYDKAFNFYYEDNLELLRTLGLSIIYFSPLADKKLPECDYVYIGGGFPEIFAKELEDNYSMRASIYKAYQENMPIYAECGGLMYLGKRIQIKNNEFEMVGIFDGISRMTDRLQHFGYCQACALKENSLTGQGDQLYGHEFHHSQFITKEEPIFRINKMGTKEQVWEGGYAKQQVVASYLHIHFYNQLKEVERFLRNGFNR